MANRVRNGGKRQTEGGYSLRVAFILILMGICVGLASAIAVEYAGSYDQVPQPVITGTLIKQRLQYIQELSTLEYYYTNMGKFENKKNMPLTGKRFIVSYDGVIKAGIDLGGIRIEVNEEEKTVAVTLPECRLLSHEILDETIQVYDESGSIFNPISIQDYIAFTREQKTLMEEKAETGGLLENAAERAELTVTALLEGLPGMEDYHLTVRQAEGT